jgi:hypothetical protein
VTRAFDVAAAAKTALPTPPTTIPVVRDVQVRPCAAKDIRGYIAKFHYTETFPDSTRFSFWAWAGDTFAGAITFGMGVGKSQYLALLPDVARGEYVELTRLWSPDYMPTNTESRIIGQAIRQLPKSIRLVMSFADSAEKHRGTIYQAANFTYHGMTTGGKMLLDTATGVKKHPRLLGIYRKRHPDTCGKMTTPDLMAHLGFESVPAGKKHRYALGRRPQDRKHLQTLALPYPCA